MLALTNEVIQVEVAPEVGGRIISFADLRSGYDFVWRNQGMPLRREEPGTEYDPNFFGGFDELLPNDMPEEIAGVKCPDHGELWTAEFSHQQVDSTTLMMETHLPGVQFDVIRRMKLDGNDCRVETRITNRSQDSRPFLWKLHAALNIAPGDLIECSARNYTVADPEWSRRKFDGLWTGETVPQFDGTTEFLYLHELKEGSIGWRRGGKSFAVQFDLEVFPYAWYFASYGGFDGHQVSILEPCTCMPMSVNEADSLGKCSRLDPGASLETEYIYRGVVHED